MREREDADPPFVPGSPPVEDVFKHLIITSVLSRSKEQRNIYRVVDQQCWEMGKNR